MRTKNPVVVEYFRFMIGHKEVSWKGFRNRKALDFYRLLRLKADFFKCSIMDIIIMESYFVLRGELLTISDIERLKQIA